MDLLILEVNDREAAIGEAVECAGIGERVRAVDIAADPPLLNEAPRRCCPGLRGRLQAGGDCEGQCAEGLEQIP
jgi:hypothetical protein